MKIDRRLLTSKLGQRIITLFFVCALLPIGAVAVVSFTQVTNQLQEQIQTRLREASKSRSMAIFERLELLEGQLRMVGLNLGADAAAFSQDRIDDDFKLRFRGLAFEDSSGEIIPLFGQTLDLPDLTLDEMEHLRLARSLVGAEFETDGSARLIMRLAVDPRDLSRGVVAAELNSSFLWGLEALLASTQLCVLDDQHRILFCGFEDPASFLDQLESEADLQHSGYLEWIAEDEGTEYVAGYWSVFLNATFLTPSWTIAITQSRDEVLGPIVTFQRMFPFIILMSVWVVLLLSLIQIRRSLVPLERLQEGTRRIAEQDFDSRVSVTSGDEFEELAASFNAMAQRLGKQFKALNMANEIDRAILLSSDTEKVADALVTHMPDIVQCDAMGVTFMDSNGERTARTFLAPVEGEPRQVVVSRLMPQEEEFLRNHPEGVTIGKGAEVPPYAQPLADQGMQSISVLPLFVKDHLSGMFSLGYRDSRVQSEEDLVQERQVADQVTVALSNAQLTQEQQKLMGLFERYVSPEAAAEIWRRREEITLAGEEMTATVLFSDIRNLSTRWAGRPSQEALAWLNHYLTAMSEIVIRHGGFVNKFMGDGLMVLFGVPLGQSVPDEARQAVGTALEMLAWVKQANADKEDGEEPLRIGIGIHTGTLTAGNVGAANRLEYSVIGENVNLAARLEELTKEFPADLILSAETRQLVEGHFEFELLAEVVVRGFSKKSQLYTVNQEPGARVAQQTSAPVEKGGVV